MPNMNINKDKIWNSLFDAIVMNDLYEINDENVENLIDTITEWLYRDLFINQ